MRTWLIGMAAAAATAATLVLTGCGGGGGGAAPTDAPAPPEHAAAGDIISEPCEHQGPEGLSYDATCGHIFVPENRADAGARLIALPFRRIHAQTDTPGEPVFVLNGGPGFSNMPFRTQVPWYLVDRDIVLIGYRGADGTVRLSCPEVVAALRGADALLGAQAFEDLSGGYARCAERHRAAGVDLNGYDMVEVVDDVDALRTALGYDRINLLSVSYGTRLAMIYGWRYPDHVRRSAMVGVNPPGRFVFDPALFEAQIARYAELCAEDAYCSGRTDDLAGDIARALENMPERWLAFPINRDAVTFATFMSLFSTNQAAGVFDMWLAAADGDYSGAALMTMIAPMLLPAELTWGDYAAKGLSGGDFAYDPSIDYPAALRPGAHLLGAPGNVLGWASAAGWPHDPIAEEYRRAQPSAVETLLVSGSLDPSTPAEAAREELLPYLENGEQVALSEFAHGVDLFYAQPEATRQLLTTFFATGEVDASAFTPRAVNFDPGRAGFPFLAKAALAAALILAAILALAAWFVVRRVFGGKRSAG